MAPATWIGPVTTWGPSRCGSRDMVAAISTASSSTPSAGTPCAPKKASGSLPWSSRMPSWLTVSIVTLSPSAMCSTGGSTAQGSLPQRTVAGVAGR